MADGTLGYKDTPILPDSGYHVHDSDRPQPPVVTPGGDNGPPSDATVLFDGSDLSAWEGRDGAAAWIVRDGYMEVTPKTGAIHTGQTFGSVQLHLEFAEPAEVKGDSQGRGNSGVFLMGIYEIQVLDSYENPTYADGSVGAIYGQYPPMANAIRKPGEWNSYDIVWEAPEFDGETVKKPAYVTVFLNGVLLHHRKKLLGKTGHKTLAGYAAHDGVGPLELQDHGDPVRFRNIWIRELSGLDAGD
ncbi:MAG: hypothetical protein CMN78_02220 [Spirochaetales bacterium]|nr:hypothetical protein [Spirochaetales bacterium]MAG13391.1 hypothetical protein [Spirochaetales bacterium]